MEFKRVKSISVTTVEYTYGWFTILTRVKDSAPIRKVEFKYFDPETGDTVQIEMTRDDLGELLALLTQMQLNKEFHIPTDYVTN